jgi:hypothetical protein
LEGLEANVLICNASEGFVARVHRLQEEEAMVTGQLGNRGRTQLAGGRVRVRRALSRANQTKRGKAAETNCRAGMPHLWLMLGPSGAVLALVIVLFLTQRVAYLVTAHGTDFTLIQKSKIWSGNEIPGGLDFWSLIENDSAQRSFQNTMESGCALWVCGAQQQTIVFFSRALLIKEWGEVRELRYQIFFFANHVEMCIRVTINSTYFRRVIIWFNKNNLLFSRKP